MRNFALRLLKMPSWLLVVSFTIFGILLALFISWTTIFPPIPEPSPLPMPPSKATGIYSISTDSFFEAIPHIETEDGQSYRLSYENGVYVWVLDPDPPSQIDNSTCESGKIEIIEEAASQVVACQTVTTIGEWCPGSIVSIAITENGEVWELIEEEICIFFFITFAITFAPISFALGILIIVIRHAAMYLVKKLYSNSH